MAPRHPAGSSVVGSLSSSTAMHLAIALEPRDPAALAAYATDVATSGSSVYHHYLTVAQFRQRFGPTDVAIAAVEAALRADGLSPAPVSANGLSIDVSGTAGAVSHALATSFQRVRLRSGRVAFANTEAPLLSSSVSGYVQSVLGLENLVVPQRLGLKRGSGHGHAQNGRHPHTSGPQPCSTATSVAEAQGTYTHDQIASAYQFSSYYAAGDEGAGQTVALFELENNFPDDIKAFEDCYGIDSGTASNVSYSLVDGGPGPPSVANEDGLETELDIENIVGFAPKADVVVYQGPYFTSATDAEVDDVYTAMVTSGANILSTSWGECESQETKPGAEAEETIYEEAATQGQSMFAAAGDDGSEDCTDDNDNPIAGLAVDDPASDPYVTSGGGTSMSQLGPPPTESVWNDSCEGSPCGGGGGISTFWTMPAFQSSAPSYLNLINANSSGTPCGAPSGSYCREVPDVSALADPSTGYTIYWDGNGTGMGSDTTGWDNGTPLGGTSAVGPLMSGFTALVNASSECTSDVGYMNPALYKAAASAYQLDFNDITTGNNGLPGFSPDLYPAGTGYDMASGLGSPIAPMLGANLCSGSAVSITNPGGQAAVIGVPFHLQLSGADSAGQTLTWGASGLPPGLTFNAGTQVLSGTPTVTGTYKLTVVAMDSHSSNAEQVFELTVDPVAVTLTSPGNLSNKAGASLNVHVKASDNNGGALTYSASGLPKGLSINKSTGVISGTPTSGGKYSVTLTATDGSVSATVKFTWTITGPYASHAALGGIGKGKPKLSLTFKEGLNSSAIKKLVIGLPRGLSFTGNFRGVKVVGSGHYKLSLSHGKLVITLKRTLTQVGITVSPPSDKATASLRTKVKHHKLKSLTVTVTVTGSNGHTSTLRLSLTPS